MIGMELSIDDGEWQREFRELQMDGRVKLALLLETVGVETVAYLRSLTSDMRPPHKPGAPHRRAHPGGWADRSGQLVNSYYFAVLVGGTRLVWSDVGAPGKPEPVIPRGKIPDKLPRGDLTLELGNGAEYAVHLENRDGYWVLTGVTEADSELIETLRRVGRALGFEIT